MNDLTVLTNSIAKSDRGNIARTVLAVCTAITPQFYKNKSTAELQAEKASIELLTQGMEAEVISEMCNLAARNYALDRSKDSRVFFDINYIIRFYQKAIEKVHPSPAGLSLVLDWYIDADGVETEVLGDIGGLDVETGEYMGERKTVKVLR